jgi:hypothetical protein
MGIHALVSSHGFSDPLSFAFSTLPPTADVLVPTMVAGRVALLNQAKLSSEVIYPSLYKVAMVPFVAAAQILYNVTAWTGVYGGGVDTFAVQNTNAIPTPPVVPNPPAPTYGAVVGPSPVQPNYQIVIPEFQNVEIDKGRYILQINTRSGISGNGPR